VEAAQTEITLDKLAVGARLVVRSRTDWRFAAIAKVVDEKVVLTVCSPSGHTYRLRREPDTTILMVGKVPVLAYDAADTWLDNFGRYDHRW
jgi:hypothetical protein